MNTTIDIRIMLTVQMPVHNAALRVRSVVKEFMNILMKKWIINYDVTKDMSALKQLQR